MSVMNLWCVTIRPLSMISAGRLPFNWHIATKSLSERDVVAQARKRFAGAWWEENIVTDVLWIGQLHMIEGEALHERD